MQIIYNEKEKTVVVAGVINGETFAEELYEFFREKLNKGEIKESPINKLK